MIKNIINAVKYKDINLYPIGVEAYDEVESNNIVSDIVKYLRGNGVDARVHIAYGTIFGYVFCKSGEIEEIAKLIPSDKKCSIIKEPVDKDKKQMIVRFCG